MSLIFKLPKIIEESRAEYEAIKNRMDVSVFNIVESRGTEPGNMIVHGENMEFMKHLLFKERMGGGINLIYVDPPFYSGADYHVEVKLCEEDKGKTYKLKRKAYKDTWGKGKESYLKMLTLRLLFMKDLLSEDGSLWVHLDWHAVHYVKVILDEIFGEENFINEIIWHYKSGGASGRRFARKHDTLLFYGKSSDYYFMTQKEKSYNRGLKPYSFNGVSEFRDEAGWYTMVNQKDVWYINMVGRTSSERTGYATQKPEALMERILKSCTQPGDLCADFFSGSGTLAAVANKMGRRWISCDIGRQAVLDTFIRIAKQDGSYIMCEGEEVEPVESRDSRLKIDVITKPDFGGQGTKMVVKLKSYDPGNTENIASDDKDLEMIRKIAKEDSLSLLVWIGIDWDYDGIIFRPRRYSLKDPGPIVTDYEFKIIGTPAVKTVDIFGNATLVTIISDE